MLFYLDRQGPAYDGDGFAVSLRVVSMIGLVRLAIEFSRLSHHIFIRKR
ncbi:hypothetical protein ACUN9Y_02895 [Halomonas sp. V046]